MKKLLLSMLMALLTPLIIGTANANNNAPQGENDIVVIDPAEYGVVLDLRYQTSNNFTKKPLYTNHPAYLHKDSAKKLLIATQYAKTLGYKIKIFDAFRPLKIQKKLYDAAVAMGYEKFVSSPDRGVAPHARGVAMDITLVDAKTGKELDMGTGFDTFDDAAHFSPNMKKEVLNNRMVLVGIMSVAGFTPLQSEWWHYDLRLYENFPDYKDHPKIQDFPKGE